jgi:hypothetical protein
MALLRPEFWVAVALADRGSLHPDGVCGVGVTAPIGLEPNGDQEVAALDALAAHPVEQTVAASEPAGRAGALPAHEEVVPDPPGAASSARHVTGVKVAVMSTFESVDVVVVPPEHVRSSGQQLQILRLHEIVLVGQ